MFLIPLPKEFRDPGLWAKTNWRALGLPRQNNWGFRAPSFHSRAPISAYQRFPLGVWALGSKVNSVLFFALMLHCLTVFFDYHYYINASIVCIVGLNQFKTTYCSSIVVKGPSCLPKDVDIVAK